MNRQWADRWLNESFNKADLEALRALYDPQVRFADIPLGLELNGRDAVIGFLGSFLDPAAGEHRFLPIDYLGDAHAGVVEWVWEGRMAALDLLQIGQPTPGKTIHVRGNSVFRFGAGGLVTEERDYWDMATVRRQLVGDS